MKRKSESQVNFEDEAVESIGTIRRPTIENIEIKTEKLEDDKYIHVLSRSTRYPYSEIRRFYFPDNIVDWTVSKHVFFIGNLEFWPELELLIFSQFLYVELLNGCLSFFNPTFNIL